MDEGTLITTSQPPLVGAALLEECVEVLPSWFMYLLYPLFGTAIVSLVILGFITSVLAKKTKIRIEEEYEEHSEYESERESIDIDEMRDLYEVIPEEYRKRDSLASSGQRSSLHQINEEEEEIDEEGAGISDDSDDEHSEGSVHQKNVPTRRSPTLSEHNHHHHQQSSRIPSPMIPGGLKRQYALDHGDSEASVVGLLATNNSSLLFIDEC